MKIQSKEENFRLDQYLARELDISRSKIQKDIKEGLVKVNGKNVNSSFLLSIDDEIEITKRNSKPSTVEPLDIPLDAVYEDEYLLVINKQSGLVVHPAPGHYTDTLVNALTNKFRLSNIDNERPGIVHRIDKDTSGLMLVAKDDKTHELLSEMIKNKEVERVYWAIVDGVIKHDTGTIDAPIGREAITNFKVLKRFEKNTLVECKLDTGRTHQIRVHFNYIGYPVHGDPVYGRKSSVDSFGQYLHSKTIRFVHPITKEELFFDSPLPPEFIKKLESLEQ